jgi:glycerol transport system ATP-binding protein
MNLLAARSGARGLEVAGRLVVDGAAADAVKRATLLGIRPEYVTIAAPEAAGAVPVTVDQAQDIGTYWLLTTRAADGTRIRARLHPHQAIPQAGDAAWLQIHGAHTCFYENELLIASSGQAAQGVNA